MDEKESAARRTWAVMIQPIPGLKGPEPKIMIVQATSERTAKLSAWNKAMRGAYVHRAYKMWRFEIKELSNEQAG